MNNKRAESAMIVDGDLYCSAPARAAVEKMNIENLVEFVRRDGCEIDPLTVRHHWTWNEFKLRGELVTEARTR